MKDHTKNRTAILISKPSKDEWAKWAGGTDLVLSDSDKFVITAGVVSVVTLVLHLLHVISDEVAWFMVGIMAGCFIVAAIDSLRRSLNLW